MASKGYTQVDHWYQDFIAPILSPAERACMDYIIRRTTGYNKGHDTIAIAQFTDGISIGDHVLDLGTGYGKTAVGKALSALQEKGLVDARYACTNCDWEQKPTEAEPTTLSRDAASPQCPRCRRSLSRAYARSAWTMQKIVDLLNKTYEEKDDQRESKNQPRLGIVFAWDSEVKRIIREQHGTEEEKETKRALQREEALRLMNLLWYPKLVNELIVQAKGVMKQETIAPIRVINDFYKPVLKLQEDYPMAALLKYALEETASRNIAADTSARNPWHRYTRAICRKHEYDYKGFDAIPGSNADKAQKNSIENRKVTLQQLLARASNLNDKGDTQAARELLSELLSDAMIESVKELFGGDKEKTDYQIRLAFKQGSDDFENMTIFPYGADYYPDWAPQQT